MTTESEFRKDLVNSINDSEVNNVRKYYNVHSSFDFMVPTSYACCTINSNRTANFDYLGHNG
jgi:hypothetical protein